MQKHLQENTGNSQAESLDMTDVFYDKAESQDMTDVSGNKIDSQDMADMMVIRLRVWMSRWMR